MVNLSALPILVFPPKSAEPEAETVESRQNVAGVMVKSKGMTWVVLALAVCKIVIEGQGISVWSAKLPEQVTLFRQLLATDSTATRGQLSTRLGRKSAGCKERMEGYPGGDWGINQA
jgi:hypothetical protein